MVNSGRAPIRSRRLQLRLGLVARTDADRLLAPAAAGQLGQRGERLLGAAEMVDELAKRDGPDVVAADQAEARQPLCGVRAVPAAAAPASGACVAQDRLPILLSWPSSRRRMLAWCLRKISAAMMSTNGKPAQPVTR